VTERHGHIVPLPSGLRARCGGPALCPKCRAEVDHLAAHLAEAVALAVAPYTWNLTRAQALTQDALRMELETYLREVKG